MSNNRDGLCQARDVFGAFHELQGAESSACALAGADRSDYRHIDDSAW